MSQKIISIFEVTKRNNTTHAKALVQTIEYRFFSKNIETVTEKRIYKRAGGIFWRYLHSDNFTPDDEVEDILEKKGVT